MSDNANRTEQATHHKLREAKRKGHFARSRDLSSALVLFCAVLGMAWLGTELLSSLQNMLRGLLEGAFYQQGRELPVPAIREAFASTVLYRTFPFLGLLAAFGFMASVAPGGFNLSAEPLKLNFNKFNPATGMKKLFSTQSVVALIKNSLVVLILIWISWATLNSHLDRLPLLVMEPLGSTVALLREGLFSIAFRFALCLVLIGALDYGFQIYKFKQEMKMTKQEVKDDHKSTEGNPLIKSRIRRLQYKRAYQRMLASIPQATAVVTNPTHYAVAIQYEPETMDAPLVVAKGKDHLALKIRHLAEQHGVPVVENKFLAQSLFKTAEVGDRIPSLLYHAVAELLAYLYKSGKWKKKILAS